MSSKDKRVLGRVLAIEEMNVVAGGTGVPTDSQPIDETLPGRDSGTLTETGAERDSHISTDTSPTIDFSQPATEQGVPG